MQYLFIAASVLALLTSVVHSVLGEIIIFKHLRKGSLIPNMGALPLRERNIRIIWATWHLSSVFGWAFAGVLFRLGIDPTVGGLKPFIVSAIVFAYLGSGLLVLVGTKGRHPGWVALLLIAAFTWVANSAA